MKIKPTHQPTNEQWKNFAQRIIDTNGNPSTKDAEECGIPFGVYFEIALSGKNSKENLVANAHKVMAKCQ